MQESNGGAWDAYIAKLNAAGDALIYSTYHGGSGNESGYKIAVDTAGNAYVIGGTLSGNFPTENPYQANYGGEWDAFAIKISVMSYVYFAEMTVGGGCKTIFALCNTGAIQTTGNLYLMDQQGNLLTVSSSSLGEGSSFPIDILPGGTMFLTVDLPNPGDSGQSGWAMAEVEGSLGGCVLQVRIGRNGNGSGRRIAVSANALCDHTC